MLPRGKSVLKLNDSNYLFTTQWCENCFWAGRNGVFGAVRQHYLPWSKMWFMESTQPSFLVVEDTAMFVFSGVSRGARPCWANAGGKLRGMRHRRRFRAPKQDIIKNPRWHTLWGAGCPFRGAGLPFGAPILRAMLPGKPSVHVLVGEKTRNALFSNLAIFFPVFCYY